MNTYRTVSYAYRETGRTSEASAYSEYAAGRSENYAIGVSGAGEDYRSEHAHYSGDARYSDVAGAMAEYTECEGRYESTVYVASSTEAISDGLRPSTLLGLLPTHE